jgi:2-polyprenyl-3-methyl-5-hydroxy-6-metoxy-1,4-benzoquinol methylase
MKKTLAHDIYNNKKFAGRYAAQIGRITDKAFYERPAVLSILPDVRNKKVLDAGCGPGVFCEWLLDNGAQVTAIDYSSEMINIVKQKFPEKVKLYNTDLNQPLNFLGNEEFDIIICTMVLLHIDDLNPVFSEFSRVLKDQGVLVFSTVHPFADYLEYGGNYFETELIEEEWPEYNIKMPSYRRSLQSVFAALKNNHFLVGELLEPQPETAESFSGQPWFLLVKALKLLNYC